MTPPKPTHAIVYYSLTGHTDQLAHRLASSLNADVFRISVARYERGFLGYIRAGFDSLTGRLPATEPIPDLSGYDGVSIGAPIWTSYPASPLRAYLAQKPRLPKTVGCFLTCGAPSPNQKAFGMVERLLGRKIVAQMIIPNALDDASVTTRLTQYCSAVHAASGSQATL